MSSSCLLQSGHMAVMFSVVQYRAIDYSCEAAARHRLLINLLMLPVPIQLGTDTYPHLGHLQKAYRTPWTRENLKSTWQLEVTGSVLDDLRAKMCLVDSLERFGVPVLELGEVVPSSNPASQDFVESEELLWLNSAEHLEWRDRFSPADLDSAYFSYQDLFLTEELIISDPFTQFRSRLPAFLTLVQRLKPLTVSDPLLHHSRALVCDRHCEPYVVSGNGRVDGLEVQSFSEEFRKEPVLTEEVMMLPVGIEPAVVQKRDPALCISGLRGFLNISPEAAEDQNSLLDTLRTVAPAAELDCLEFERFDKPRFDTDITQRASSPVPYKSYTEMETDLLLSPPARPVLPELFLSTGHLSAELLSPVNRPVLLSDRTCQVMEQSVWKAEKQLHCVSDFLLAEPQICDRPFRAQSFPELLSLLVSERDAQDIDWFTSLPIPSMLNLQPQSSIQWPLIEGMTVENQTDPEASVDTAEEFSPLTVLQIDELLRDSATCSAQAVDSSESETSFQSTAAVSSVPSCVQSDKMLKFIIVEEPSQKQTILTENRPDNGDIPAEPTTANNCQSESTQRGVLSDTPSSKDHLNFLPENTPSQIHTDLKPPQDSPTEQKPDKSLIRSSSTASLYSSEQIKLISYKEEEKVSAPKGSALKRSPRIPVTNPQEDLDPLSSFMLLRILQRSPVVQNSQHTSTVQAAAADTQKCTRTPTAGSGLPAASEKTKNSETSPPPTEKAFSKTIYIQATESERFAYWELHTSAVSYLSRVRESDPNALGGKDISSLTNEDTRFYLKQQEKLLSMGQGKEGVHNDTALLHTLVTVKEILLRCDLNTAIEYLAELRITCSVDDLLKRLQVLQYLSYRKQEEPRPRVLQLLEQTSSILRKNTSDSVLVVTAVENVRAELVTALSQVPGSFPTAVRPDEGRNRVDSRSVLNSLSCSRCVIVCSQQVGADFPWRRFSVVLEFDCVHQTIISSCCSQNNVKYICFCTAAPETGPEVSPQVYLDCVPFLLFISEGSVKRTDLLQHLESTYNMTLLERSYSQSLQTMGATDLFDVITVDEKTAIVLQEVEELQQEQVADRVVNRLSALSLQFSRCWIILHCTEEHSKLVCGDVFSNLVLMYSAFVLFGLKTEDLDIKVFLVCDVEDMAWCVHQICLHTLLNSERSVWDWLDRDWFSVLPTQEEKCLVSFPCVNPVVAQLMLRRAPSLQWLLGASFSELQDAFPEIPHKVCKLFSHITALHRLSAAPSLPESETPPPSQSNDMLPPHLHPAPHPQLPPWAVNEDESHLDSAPSESHTPLFLTRSPTVLDSQGFAQPQGIVGTHWYGGECGAAVGRLESECGVCDSDLQPRPGEHIQHESYTGPFRGGEEQWLMDALPVPQPNLSHTVSHSPCITSPASAAPYNQPSPVEEMETLALQQWRSSAVSSRGQQSDTYSISPQYQRGLEMKRPASDNTGDTVFPQYKRAKLLFERIPGRFDGQTRLRFF